MLPIKKTLARFCEAFALAVTGFTELAGGIIASLGVAYIILEAVRKEESDMVVAILTVAGAVLLLVIGTGYKLLRLQETMRPRLKLESGGNTTGRDKFVVSLQTHYDFFGVWITNLGAGTVKKFQLRLIGLEKNGVPFPAMSCGLWFEPQDQGDDLERVALMQHVTEKSAICSVSDANEVKIGSCGFRWRHGNSSEFFREPANYTFVVQMIGKDFETRTERFVFRWTGRRVDSDIRHETEAPPEWGTPPVAILS
jgi:hypothetical protein